MKPLLLIGVIVAAIIYLTEAQQCKRAIDIVFAIDSSGSTKHRDFLKEKRFIQHLSRKFIISYRSTHVGVIVYSTKASIAVPLNKHYKWIPFAKAVGLIPFERGDTRIDLALKKAQVIFEKENGGRVGIPKVLIVLTDGQQSMVYGEIPQLDYAVLPLRKKGVKVYAIGIGSKVRKRQLRLLVEKPSDLLIARSSGSLRKHIYSITSRLCSSAIPPAFGIYPFNAKYRGQDISENRGPTAGFSKISRSWGPRGQDGGALFFRGKRNSFVDIPNRARGKLDTRTSTSIFIWVRLSRKPGPIVNYRRNGVGVGLFYYGRRTISANFVGRNGYFRQRLIYKGVDVKIWHYIGMTYNHLSGYGRLWIDEEQVRSRIIGRVLLATQYPIRLGSVSYMSRHFQGRMTCLQIYNAALNENQIKAIKNRCNSPGGTIDQCQNKPCFNGGSCIKTPKSREGFRCRCRSGYYGQYCQNNRGRPTMRPTRRPTRRPTTGPRERLTGGTNSWTSRPSSGATGAITTPPVTTRPSRKPAHPGKHIKNIDLFRMNIVEYINVFRRMHGVGPVIISDDINTEAQKWALYISSLGTGQTDPNSTYGRTICLRAGKRENIAKQCVIQWYEMVKDYDWHENSISTSSMDFVQMIWKSSLRVGVGAILGGRGRYYVVVYYDQPGNQVGRMKDNVPGFTDVFLMVYGATCEKGFLEYQGNCYKYHPQKVTWDEAVKRCTYENATLLSLHDPREGDFLGNVPLMDKNGILWSGLNNRNKESDYMNTDGSGIEYVDWEANEPHGGNERCVAVNVRQTFYRYGTMSDRRCTEKHPFVAKKPLEGIVTYRLTIDVLSLVWVDDLAIPGTLAFLQLKTRFEDVILKMYEGEKTLVSAMIERFNRKKPSPSKIKPINKPSKQPTSRILSSGSPYLRTPTNGRLPTKKTLVGRPTNLHTIHKVTASIILKFSQGLKPDPTLPFQEALKNNNGKLPPPVNQEASITKIRILKPGEDFARTGTCNPYCVYQCMSNCNPLCCSSKIATNLVNPMMANAILQRQMALLHRRDGYTQRMSMNQRKCVPSLMNRCLPNGMQRTAFNQDQMQMQMDKGTQHATQGYKPTNQGCIPGAGLPCASGQGMQMSMQWPFFPLQNMQRQNLMPNPMLQMQRLYPLQNPMMQKPYLMPKPMLQKPLDPIIQRRYPIQNPMGQISMSPYMQSNPYLQGLKASRQKQLMQKQSNIKNVSLKKTAIQQGMVPFSTEVECIRRSGFNCLSNGPKHYPAPPAYPMPRHMAPFTSFGPQRPPYLQQLQSPFQFTKRPSIATLFAKRKPRSKKPIHLLGAPLPTIYNFVSPPQPHFTFPMTPRCIPTRSKPCTKSGKSRSVHPAPIKEQTQSMMNIPRVNPFPQSFGGTIQNPLMPQQQPIGVNAADLPNLLNKADNPMQQSNILGLLQHRPMQYPFPQQNVVTKKENKGGKAKKRTKAGKGSSIETTAPSLPTIHIAGYPLQPPLSYQQNNILGPMPMQRPMPIPIERPMPMPVLMPMPIERPMPMPVPMPMPIQSPVLMPKQRPIPIPMPVQRPVSMPMQRTMPVPIQRPMPMQRPIQIPMQRPIPIPMPVQRSVSMPMQRTMPMPMQRTMPMPMPMPIQRPVLMPKQRPIPIPMPVQRPMPMPMQRPMPMPVQRPMPMPMPVQRPMPMPMQRPMPMPVQRPMPMPMQRPMPMPVQRPMPMPVQRPIQMPMQRPMPVLRQTPSQFPQLCVPSKRCPQKKKNKTKGLKKPKMIHILGAPIPGPPPMTYILPPPPQPLQTMTGQPCIPNSSTPCASFARSMTQPVPMKRPLPIPMRTPVGMPMGTSMVMPMQQPLSMRVPRPVPKRKLKKNVKSKQMQNFRQMYDPMAPMPGNPCIPNLFGHCPPVGKPILVSQSPLMPMQYRHPFSGLQPITSKPVSPVVVHLPNIVLKYPVKQKSPRPAVPKTKRRMPIQNRLTGTMPYEMQMQMQTHYPMAMGMQRPMGIGMPNIPRPPNPFTPYINPRSCALSCLKPQGIFCPSYCPKSCCARGKAQLRGKKRNKIAKPKKY